MSTNNHANTTSGAAVPAAFQLDWGLGPSATGGYLSLPAARVDAISRPAPGSALSADAAAELLRSLSAADSDAASAALLPSLDATTDSLGRGRSDGASMPPSMGVVSVGGASVSSPDTQGEPVSTDSPRSADKTPQQRGLAPERPVQDAAPVKPEEGANLFVAGLPPSVDDAALERTFKPFGEVLSAKVMLHVDTAVSRGFGFVLFRHAADAAKARSAMHGHAIEGHGGRLQVSVSRHKGENLGAESRVVYVRNVPATIGETRLREHFAKFGTVQSLRVKASRPAAGSPPSSFVASLVVEFASCAEARACVAGTHGKTPFPECASVVLAKVEEPQELREQRLAKQRSVEPATTNTAANRRAPAAALHTTKPAGSPPPPGYHAACHHGPAAPVLPLPQPQPQSQPMAMAMPMPHQAPYAMAHGYPVAAYAAPPPAMPLVPAMTPDGRVVMVPAAYPPHPMPTAALPYGAPPATTWYAPQQ